MKPEGDRMLVYTYMCVYICMCVCVCVGMCVVYVCYNGI